MTARTIDLSHPIVDGMLTYPGLPGPRVTTFLDRAETAPNLDGVSFHVGRIDMVANTGTYLDAPYHFHADGADIAGLATERLVNVPVAVVPAVGAVAVDAAHLADLPLTGHAVLVHTGWSRHWGTPAYFRGSPFLTREAVGALVAAGPALVGIDSLNIDDVDDRSRPAHQLLLGAGIPILEHLTDLDRLPDRGALLTALPPPVAGIGTMPVRAVATLPPGPAAG